LVNQNLATFNLSDRRRSNIHENLIHKNLKTNELALSRSCSAHDEPDGVGKFVAAAVTTALSLRLPARLTFGSPDLSSW
jgi:hypothetical protein